MAVNLTTLFTRWGKMLFAVNTLDTARLTLVADEVQDVLDEFAGETVNILTTVDNLPDAIPAWQSASGSIASQLKTSFNDLLVAMVKADNQQPDDNLLTAYEELLRQMAASSDDVDASTVTATASAASGNIGNGSLVVSVKRGDGRNEENLYAEDIVFVCTSAGLSAAFSIAGEPSVDYLSEQWPDGSGASGGTSAAYSADGLLSNGGFEDEDDLANAPDDWVIVTGTPGTTLRLTDPEVQTVVISGTPTAGGYWLKYTNAAGQVQTTGLIAFDAEGDGVATALNALVGAENWTVESTGTSPNFTHAVSMVGGPGGNVSQLTSTASALFTGSGGSIAHATTTSGGIAMRGSKSLEFIGGATLNTVQFPFATGDLEPETSYVFNIFGRVDVVPAAGTVRVVLWDGAAVVNDAQGVANSLTIAVTACTTSFVAKNVVFRTPAILPPVLFLRIETTVAITAGSSLYLDEAVLDASEVLYVGGPCVKMFSGTTLFEVGDRFTLAMTNDRAGLFQTGVLRLIGLPEKLLPSDSGGTESLLDALVS